MFDYYVNSIDDIKTTEVGQHNGNENVKFNNQDKEVIESLLNTIPADIASNDKSLPLRDSEEPDYKGL